MLLWLFAGLFVPVVFYVRCSKSVLEELVMENYDADNDATVESARDKFEVSYSQTGMSLLYPRENYTVVGASEYCYRGYLVTRSILMPFTLYLSLQEA